MSKTICYENLIKDFYKQNFVFNLKKKKTKKKNQLLLFIKLTTITVMLSNDLTPNDTFLILNAASFGD